METPLISVIIPYYKGERFIKATLESVFRQNYLNLEIIVVNDGSPQDSLSSLKYFGNKIKIISQENKGQSAARNVGLKQAKGSFTALLDQDDLWPDNHISIMLPHLLNDDSCDFVQGVTQDLYTLPDSHQKLSEPIFRVELVGSALYRSKVFKIVGGFDEKMPEGEDFDWTIRLKESHCRGKIISETTLLHYYHESNLSATKDFIKKGQLNSLRKKLERARQLDKSSK